MSILLGLQSYKQLIVLHFLSSGIFGMVFPMFRRRQWHPTSILLPGKSRGQWSLVGCSPWDRWESDMTELLHFHFSLSCIGEGNGNPLQCSCLENPRDGGAWWLPSMGSHRVGHDWSDLAVAIPIFNFPALPWGWTSCSVFLGYLCFIFLFGCLSFLLIDRSLKVHFAFCYVIC